MASTTALDEGMNQCSVYFTEEKEKSYEATATHSHWVNYSLKNGSPSENFADFTEGNNVKAFLGGKAYFAELLNAFKEAQKTIYITGWQVNWDAQLAEGVRLVDALLEQVKSKPQLKVYIMPWDCTSPVQTYAKATERVFAALNVDVGWEAFYVRLAGEQSGIFFSHHQKCVIIDESVAFIGGIDLAYGRYDEYNGQSGGYVLKPDAEGRHGLNMYNSCIRYIEPAKESGFIDTVRYDPVQEYITPPKNGTLSDKAGLNNSAETLQSDILNNLQSKSIEGIINAVSGKHQWQSPDLDDNESDKKIRDRREGYHYLDATVQPRMPWQDYHVRIEGPATDDLIRNFVLRWNSYLDHAKGHALQTNKPPLQYKSGYYSPKAGSCQIQVLRSASLEMRNLEFDGSVYDDLKTNNPTMFKPALAQNDILKSMHLLISKAEHYIYIENQFFVSAFGTPSVEDFSVLSDESLEIVSVSAGFTKAMPGDSNSLPVNQIAEWLGDRIKYSIYACVEQSFHVCIVLPVHPEGKLDEGSIVSQVHLTRQSLVFGTKSLLNRVRQTLWVRQKLDGESRANWADLIPGLEKQCEAERQYETISFEACAKYITLLNLRAHDSLYGMPVTEQVYVHSKLMVVDDRYVLVGSANINERSLLGDRDSELAVLIADTEGGYQDIDGSGTLSPYRKFARDLRIDIWKKLLGDAAGDKKFKSFLEMPAKAEGWQHIRELALENTRYYENVFDFIPRNYLNKINKDNTYEDNASGKPAFLWPVYKSKNPTVIESIKNMPFSVDFWRAYKTNLNFRKTIYDKDNQLKNIKGYITLLPIHWTEGENNLIDYHTALID
ncbi:phospholipase [Citrobacter freundii]|jgi:phospholipase D1/2|uniref:phospholipase D-like domain-containing protein n=1 Tax=Citrobacter freundii TaxID=546 RepID=UPI0015EAE14D|nr:phospholipase D-like domain-containing protein [Citrobacter freundii]QLY71043.1 phospholipase [Citrobacter freundii]